MSDKEMKYDLLIRFLLDKCFDIHSTSDKDIQNILKFLEPEQVRAYKDRLFEKSEKKLKEKEIKELITTK